MKCLVISDKTSGGAGTACIRLLSGLRATDGAVVECVCAKNCGMTDCVSVDGWPDLVSQIRHRLAVRWGMSPGTIRREATSAVTKNVLRYAAGIRPDVVNLHNIHERMDFSLVEKLPQDVRIVWTLHDMWPLTGYCCYSGSCEKYLSGCQGSCPQKGAWGPMVSSQNKEHLRRETFYGRNERRLVFVSPSLWLADVARRRLRDAVTVLHIPNAVNTDAYLPVQDRAIVRKALGIPDGKQVLLVGAENLEDPRKGMKELILAVGKLPDCVREQLAVVSFGSGRVDLSCGMTQIDYGMVKDERLLNLLYNSADAFVLPSLEDNLPNTLLEAVSAGTPCVSMNVGGCPEVVRNGVTGFVANDVGDLTGCIERILTMTEGGRKDMRRACRRVAEEEYRLDVQAERYLGLFEEMTGRGCFSQSTQRARRREDSRP